MVEAQAFFDEAAMQKARYVTVGSHYGKERLVTLYHLPAEKVIVIPHGSLQPAWMQFYAEFPRVVNNHPTLLAVGKMFPRKRQDVLLRAVALLRNQYPTVELRLVGDGIERDRLHALAAELGIEQAVTWLGSITDDHQMAHEWRQGDLFVHASSQETFGYVYLEAMQLGKPIVAARAGAAPEVLGEAALLVEPEQPEALAAGISQLLDDDRQRMMYSQRALVQAKRFTIEDMVAGYSQLLKTINE
jgi:glycosyltransferase involved in cell wall biosynthesis